MLFCISCFCFTDAAVRDEHACGPQACNTSAHTCAGVCVCVRTVIPDQDDVGTAVQFHLLESIHELADNSVNHPQRAVQLEHTERVILQTNIWMVLYCVLSTNMPQEVCADAEYLHQCSWAPLCVRMCPAAQSAWRKHKA